MSSDNPTGADNQQGSRRPRAVRDLLTPQRLHAELLDTGANGLEAYLQGALRDGTRSTLHNTHRFCQSDPRWIALLRDALELLGHRAWVYREGRNRNLWVVETTAAFLSLAFEGSSLAGQASGLDYVRGYFDAEGGMPISSTARLYLQFTQKDRANLEGVVVILESWDIRCGRLHNPSFRVDPEYWRFYVSSRSHERFFRLVRSWHPRKRQQIETRMKI